MDHPIANPGKRPAITACGRTFLRIPLRTHFVQIGDDYSQLAGRYAAPCAQQGDVLCISEKVIALCQGRVVYRKDIHPGFWARLLCRFVHSTPAGPGAGTPHKMQLLIMQCGLWRVLLAALCSALTRPLGLHGVFYRVCGHGAGGIDGLIDYDISYKEYYDYAILSPAEPDGVCAELEAQLGLPVAIVDACDLSVEVLGTSPSMTYSRRDLGEILRDNPAGQGDQQTPLILVRPLGGGSAGPEEEHKKAGPF